MDGVRETCKKLFIQVELVGLLRDAKHGNETAFEWDCDRLLGALDYACLVDDISEETDRRIRRLIGAIRKKIFHMTISNLIFGEPRRKCAKAVV